MIAPTPEEILDWSDAPLEEMGYPAGDRLQRLVDRAVGAFQRITGWTLASLPSTFEAEANHALQGMTEELVYRNQAERLETMADFDLVQSFTAGPYSEQRRSPKEAREARMLHPWLWVSDLLWGLLTPDQLEYWENFFNNTKAAPAFSVTEVDWQGTGLDDPYIWGA